MPCLNERETIGACVRKARQSLSENNLSGEIVVADNGSTDGSKQIAKQEGARVVAVELKGYGAAYLGGLHSARGDYLIIGDSDDTYDFSLIPNFVAKLDEGFDFVNGNRLGNLLSLKSLPTLHRYLGAIVLSTFLNILFRTGLTDAHCGMRAFTRVAFQKMNLTCPGMEFASEMLIRAKRTHLKTAEIKIPYFPRSKGSKLNPLPDAARHIYTILLFYFHRV